MKYRFWKIVALCLKPIAFPRRARKRHARYRHPLRRRVFAQAQHTSGFLRFRHDRLRRHSSRRRMPRRAEHSPSI